MASNQQAQPRAKKKRRNYSKNKEDKKLLDQALTYFFLRKPEIEEGTITKTQLIKEAQKAYDVGKTVRVHTLLCFFAVFCCSNFFVKFFTLSP